MEIIMIKYASGWNSEIASYANRFGSYKAFLESFDENSINVALCKAQSSFSDNWVKDLTKIAMDPFDNRTIWIEQGTHQAENLRSGGFCLHFTGRDNYGLAFHFYVKQALNGVPEIFEITFKRNGNFVSVYKFN
jgi:hypothetical protein